MGKVNIKKFIDDIHSGSCLKRCLTEENFFDNTYDFISSHTRNLARHFNNYNYGVVEGIQELFVEIGINEKNYKDIIKLTYNMHALRNLRYFIDELFPASTAESIECFDDQMERIMYWMIENNKALDMAFSYGELRDLFRKRKVKKFYPEFLDFVDYLGLLNQDVDFDMLIQYVGDVKDSYAYVMGVKTIKKYIENLWPDRLEEFEVVVEMLK